MPVMMIVSFVNDRQQVSKNVKVCRKWWNEHKRTDFIYCCFTCFFSVHKHEKQERMHCHHPSKRKKKRKIIDGILIMLFALFIVVCVPILTSLSHRYVSFLSPFLSSLYCFVKHSWIRWWIFFYKNYVESRDDKRLWVAL
jgi:hypothetical protein